MDKLAAIDLGSTTLKAVIYDLHGNVVAAAAAGEKVHPHADHPEWTVWMRIQMQGSAAAMKEAVSEIDDPRSIRGVAVTGMGMDGVPVDEGSNWLYPFIGMALPANSSHSTTGGSITSVRSGPSRSEAASLWRFSTALRLSRMAEHEPEILKKRTAKWLLIEDMST